MSNEWLYDGVMSFENPDYETPDSLFYNNPFGVSVYTDWMADIVMFVVEYHLI